jgi:hypothetical protein
MGKLYCIICDREDTDESPKLLTCQDCYNGFGPNGIYYTEEEKQLHAKRWQAVIEIIQEQSYQGTQNGIEDGLQTAIDVVSFRGMKKGLEDLKQRLEMVKVEKDADSA